jgi:hypothetical protein
MLLLLLAGLLLSRARPRPAVRRRAAHHADHEVGVARRHGGRDARARGLVELHGTLLRGSLPVLLLRLLLLSLLLLMLLQSMLRVTLVLLRLPLRGLLLLLLLLLRPELRLLLLLLLLRLLLLLLLLMLGAELREMRLRLQHGVDLLLPLLQREEVLVALCMQGRARRRALEERKLLTQLRAQALVVAHEPCRTE